MPRDLEILRDPEQYRGEIAAEHERLAEDAHAELAFVDDLILRLFQTRGLIQQRLVLYSGANFEARTPFDGLQLDEVSRIVQRATVVTPDEPETQRQIEATIPEEEVSYSADRQDNDIPSAEESGISAEPEPSGSDAEAVPGMLGAEASSEISEPAPSADVPIPVHMRRVPRSAASVEPPTAGRTGTDTGAEKPKSDLPTYLNDYAVSLLQSSVLRKDEDPAENLGTAIFLHTHNSAWREQEFRLTSASFPIKFGEDIALKEKGVLFTAVKRTVETVYQIHLRAVAGTVPEGTYFKVRKLYGEIVGTLGVEQFLLVMRMWGVFTPPSEG